MCRPYVLHTILFIKRAMYHFFFLQVFDNYAVTVMIGDDPYTLGLFDTAGAFSLFIYLQVWTHIEHRSGGLWPTSPSIISTNRRIPRLFQCNIAGFLWKRQREMVPWSAPSLSRCSLSHRWNTNRSSGRRSGYRQTCKAKTETSDGRARRTARPGAWSREVCWMFSADAEGLKERVRWGISHFFTSHTRWLMFPCTIGYRRCPWTSSR